MKLSDINVIEVINSTNLHKYYTDWPHVINNEEHKDFVELGFINRTETYERHLPIYSETKSIPTHPDYYEDGVRKYTYKFTKFKFVF